MLAGVIGMLCLGGCGSSPGDATRGPNIASTAADTVMVQRGDVAAVITLDGVVVPSPIVTVTATSAGVVHHDSGVKPGARVGPSGVALFGVGAHGVHAPIDGLFDGWLVPSGTDVPANLPVARVRYTGFAIEAQTPPDLAYRIFSHAVSARGEVRGGPGAFPCIVTNPDQLPTLPDPNANQGDAGSAGTGPTVTCTIPASVFAVAGLRAFVAIRSAMARDVLTLPVSAVAGSAQMGSVWVIDGHGRAHLQNVGLGVTDGSVVQITSGLRLGERVSATAPDQPNYAG
jgi:macrolide-specific efflux system membrane fusion protein